MIREISPKSGRPSWPHRFSFCKVCIEFFVSLNIFGIEFQNTPRNPKKSQKIPKNPEDSRKSQWSGKSHLSREDQVGHIGSHFAKMTQIQYCIGGAHHHPEKKNNRIIIYLLSWVFLHIQFSILELLLSCQTVELLTVYKWCHIDGTKRKKYCYFLFVHMDRVIDRT